MPAQSHRRAMEPGIARDGNETRPTFDRLERCGEVRRQRTQYSGPASAFKQRAFICMAEERSEHDRQGDLYKDSSIVGQSRDSLRGPTQEETFRSMADDMV